MNYKTHLFPSTCLFSFSPAHFFLQSINFCQAIGFHYINCWAIPRKFLGGVGLTFAGKLGHDPCTSVWLVNMRGYTMKLLPTWSSLETFELD